MPIPVFTPTDDALLTGEPHERSLVAWGMLLLLACPVTIAFARCVISINYAFFLLPIPPAVLFGFGGVIALMWITGIWLITPVQFDRFDDRGKSLRKIVRTTQIMWGIAWLLVVTASFATRVSAQLSLALIILASIASIVASLGLLVLIGYLLRLAERAQLDDAAVRLNNALWFLPFTTLFVAVLPLSLPWFALVPFALVVFGWVWCIVWFERALIEMYQHVRWSIKSVMINAGREERMKETREELDAEVESQIRPLPPESPDTDIPV